MTIDQNKSTRHILTENPDIIDICKKFGQSARRVVSEAREMGASIDYVLFGEARLPARIPVRKNEGLR